MNSNQEIKVTTTGNTQAKVWKGIGAVLMLVGVMQDGSIERAGALILGGLFVFCVGRFME